LRKAPDFPAPRPPLSASGVLRRARRLLPLAARRHPY